MNPSRAAPEIGVEWNQIGKTLAACKIAAAVPVPLWLKMLQTTSLPKSYKMVVLRVLLHRDAFWNGMEIPQLTAACRAFLENHPALRADLEGRRSRGQAMTGGKSGRIRAAARGLSLFLVHTIRRLRSVGWNGGCRGGWTRERADAVLRASTPICR